MSAPLPQPLPFGDDVPVVVLVSASWAGPSRPAPTVLRELGRRWGTAVHTLLVEDPSEEVLDALRVDVVPTWLRFVRAGADGPPDQPDASGTAAHRPPSPESEPATAPESEPAPEPEPEGDDTLVLTALDGLGPDGAAVRLDGPWVLTHRLEGAQPKHAVDDVLRPPSRA